MNPYQSSRRQFLASTASACALSGWRNAACGDEPPQTALPRWRGFNLMEFFQAFQPNESTGLISEDDLRWMSDWGFDYIRLPMDYWMWIDTDWRQTRKLKPDDVYRIDQRMMENVDRAIELGIQYGLHVSLNFHRAPGYCINDAEREPFVLWSDRRAEDAFVHHWDLFAERYTRFSKNDLSFNLVNEAPTVRDGYMTAEDYRRVMTRATEAIRRHSPDRIIIIDGLNVGNEVVDNMIPTGVAQSVHAYTPHDVSHHQAGWVDQTHMLPPAWPLLNRDGSINYDRAKLEAHYAPWAELARKGIGVHCGEAGCYNKTPYEVFYAWISDVMEILKSHGIGYSLWNFRGSFGVLDSGRQDIKMESWQGHQLDRRLLDLLRAS
jgi:aryl-phospho-beta-D-glucosidase BglC (GH1 family)